MHSIVSSLPNDFATLEFVAIFANDFDAKPQDGSAPIDCKKPAHTTNPDRQILRFFTDFET